MNRSRVERAAPCGEVAGHERAVDELTETTIGTTTNIADEVRSPGDGWQALHTLLLGRAQPRDDRVDVVGATRGVDL
jgi:hypothetical protein